MWRGRRLARPVSRASRFGRLASAASLLRQARDRFSDRQSRVGNRGRRASKYRDRDRDHGHSRSLGCFAGISRPGRIRGESATEISALEAAVLGAEATRRKPETEAKRGSIERSADATLRRGPEQRFTEISRGNGDNDREKRRVRRSAAGSEYLRVT